MSEQELEAILNRQREISTWGPRGGAGWPEYERALRERYGLPELPKDRVCAALRAMEDPYAGLCADVHCGGERFSIPCARLPDLYAAVERAAGPHVLPYIQCRVEFDEDDDEGAE
jgi:hypothetical protein